MVCRRVGNKDEENQRRPAIISVSRRTDIPAFYSEWFINRLRAGWALTYNPFNRQPMRVSLAPGEVAGLVFWSKNFRPLEPYLPEIASRGYRCFFIFTINALPRLFEPHVPDPRQAITTFRSLARLFSPEHIHWRYDPIVLTNLTPPEYHLRQFAWLCRQLEGYTRRCITSFTCFYPKVRRRLHKVLTPAGVGLLERVSLEQKRELLEQMAFVAQSHGIELHLCCDDALIGQKVKKARCVDIAVLAPLFHINPEEYRPRPTRSQCGCYESVDIGMYDTCPHLCVYCYANSNPEKALASFRAHDPTLPALSSRFAAGCP